MSKLLQKTVSINIKYTHNYTTTNFINSWKYGIKTSTKLFILKKITIFILQFIKSILTVKINQKIL